MHTMRTFTKILFSLLFALSVTSCDRDISSGFGEEISVPFGRTASLYDNGYELTIKFSSLVEESRCPPGMVCFWEGRALVEIVINSYDTYQLEFSTAGEDTQNKRIVDYQGYTIELISVSPKSDDDFGIEDKYSIVIVVSR